MKTKLLVLGMVLVLFFAVACNSGNKGAAGNVNKDQIENQLKQAGLNDVSTDVDADKAVITLSGNVQSDEQKQQAEQIAKSAAPNFVVANELGVRPQGMEDQAKKIDSAQDDAIKSQFEALSAKNKWDAQDINVDVNNGVLTLKGDVNNAAQRAQIEKAAAKIPNVEQVVNELQVRSAAGRDKRAKPDAPQSAQD